jgi:hypothetical protein
MSKINNPYTKALEDHIAQLESRLALNGGAKHVAQTGGPATPSHVVTSPVSRHYPFAGIIGPTADVDGPYIGSSSGYSIATSLGDMVQATTFSKALWVPASTATDRHDQSPSGERTFGGGSIRRITISELQSDAAEPPTEALGSRLIEAYLVRIHPRFPLLVRSDLWDYHRRRLSLSQTAVSSKEDGFAVFVLYMVYAIGALTLRLTESYKDTPPEAFYISALKHVSSAREASSIHNIEAMVLLILYHFRSESHHGLWHMVGLAMRTITDLGLHRLSSTSGLPQMEAQLRRRLFWIVYTLEGILASTLGRPISLTDCDIDQPLPLSINDDDLTGTSILLNTPAPGREAYPYTNMTQSILLSQLRRLESRIQRVIYRVDRPTTSLLPKLAPLFRDMEAWRASIPPEVRGSELDRPLLNYHKTLRLLIQPFLALLTPEDSYFQQCVVSVGQICQIHKRLHQSPQYGHSFIAVHTVFIAGITLLYCLWLGKDKVWSFSVSNNLRACSCVLSIMAERAAWVRRYRDVYEVLVEETMAALENDQHDAATERARKSHQDIGLSFDGLEFLDDGAWHMAQQLAGIQHMAN